ncbi:hypothetical protein [Microbacterium sp. NPDC089695]|uniref:hypothetical protein n=1 Tax=Microbacterium sp. NPDC089695 TaxID=3364198 RepID=UPI0037F5BCBE
MTTDDLIMRATNLGMDHAEDEHNGTRGARLYSGRQIADALGVTEQLTGARYVALRDAYGSGWSSFW